MSIFIPNNIKFLIIKNKCNAYKYTIIIYNKDQYISILVKSSYFLKKSKTLIINETNFISIKSSNNYISNYTQSWNNFFLKKIKFKGKGYKIIKYKNFLALTFNHSHIT